MSLQSWIYGFSILLRLADAVLPTRRKVSGQRATIVYNTKMCIYNYKNVYICTYKYACLINVITVIT
jgi:hypothetical protein